MMMMIIIAMTEHYVCNISFIPSSSPLIISILAEQWCVRVWSSVGYVALSQATYLPTCLEGFTLTSFHENSIVIIIMKVHLKGCDFYNRIAATAFSAPTIQNIG
jgi:hypothetical protein